MDWMVRDLIFARAELLSSSPEHMNWFWGLYSLLLNGYHGLFPWGVKPLQHGAADPHSSSAKFKVKWSNTSNPLICMHGMYENNFTFTLFSV